MRHSLRNLLLATVTALVFVTGCTALQPQYDRGRSELELGMHRDSVLELMGRPRAINASRRGADQWVYRAKYYPTYYLYIEDDTLANWQASSSPQRIP